MKVRISDDWLKVCGEMALSGLWLEVTRVRDFDSRGKFYTVVKPNGFTWEVWDVRGVETKPE